MQQTPAYPIEPTEHIAPKVMYQQLIMEASTATPCHKKVELPQIFPLGDANSELKYPEYLNSAVTPGTTKFAPNQTNNSFLQ